MFSWLLARPAIVIDLVLGGMLLAFGLYFYMTRNEINNLSKDVEEKTIQVQQNEAVISSLTERLALIQKLNDEFNKSIISIQQNQQNAAAVLQKYDLPKQSIKDPQQTQLFINQRNAQVLQHLNDLSRNINELSK